MDMGGRADDDAGGIRHRDRPALPRTEGASRRGRCTDRCRTGACSMSNPATSPPPAPNTKSAMRWLPLAVVAVLGVLLAAGVWLSRDPNREAPPSPLIGKPTPIFELPVLHEAGRTVSS